MLPMKGCSPTMPWLRRGTYMEPSPIMRMVCSTARTVALVRRPATAINGATSTMRSNQRWPW